MKNIFNVILVMVLALNFFQCSNIQPKILVFSKTSGYRHTSIEVGVEAIQKLGVENKFGVDHTEDSTWFNPTKLSEYAAVIFLSTTGNVLGNQEQLAFRNYIQAGGGFVGIHAASDTEYDWPWYGAMVGGYFKSHPKIQKAKLIVVDHTHPSTAHLKEDIWEREDEWYNFRNLNDQTKVLLKIDESSYEGGENGDDHPMAWYHEYDGGRAFYTELGHTEESFNEADFLKHILGGIQYAMSKTKVVVPTDSKHIIPEEGRFKRTVLASNLDEPMEIDVFSDGRIIMVERKGNIKLHTPGIDTLKLIKTMPVHQMHEDGLLGVAIDPAYGQNKWVYFFYSPDIAEPTQYVSRFKFEGDSINMASEQIIIKIPLQRDECCHSAGCLEFGPDGNLYISVGDNTNPFASDGFAPIDERKGRSAWDAQRSSANTNDLRGKILRIKVKEDGTYTIPEGNLFAASDSTRPEIYAMGLRNPFRISLDSERNWLFWGDVGPDSGKDSLNRGPKGYDGLILAKNPGNWGWPHTRGNRTPYNDYNFTTKTSGPLFNPDNPINNSPNNTGKNNLPKAEKYLIWYSYDASQEFPWVGTGGKNPMAGPIYYSKNFKNASSPFPNYFDGRIFFYEWMRGWIYILTLDSLGQLVQADPFMPSEEFSNPMDMVFGPDGSLYVLEYGKKWFAQNLDARLNKIEFQSGNLAPIARFDQDKIVGSVPLTVKFTDYSTDIDQDKLTYAWYFDQNVVQSTDPSPSFTFNKAGNYQVKLVVTDSDGHSSESTTNIMAGNEPPKIVIRVDGNKNIYSSGGAKYSVEVEDKEDGSLTQGIDPKSVQITLEYLPEGQDLTISAQGHQALLQQSQQYAGKLAMEGSDCFTCHAVAQKVAGPSLEEIAKKYDQKDENYLADKILQGGSGVWGETPMAAHPQLKTADIKNMVNYILSLGKAPPKVKSLATSGTLTFSKHAPENLKGIYVLMASYTDKGAAGQPALTTRETYIFKSPVFQAEDADEKSAGLNAFSQGDIGVIVGTTHAQYLKFNDVNLDGIKQLRAKLWFYDNSFGGQLMIYSDSVSSQPIAQIDVNKTVKGIASEVYNLPVKPQSGTHDLIIFFQNKTKADQAVGLLDYIELISK